MQQVALSPKRVRIFYVGGLAEIAGQSLDQVADHFERYLDLQLLAQFDFEVLHNTLGADSTWNQVSIISEAIRKHYDDYDGFLVVHPVDSAAMMSNLLAFANEPFGKPIVFTGPAAVAPAFSVPITPKELWQRQAVSLRTNLLSSMQLATSEATGTLLSYNLVALESERAIPQFEPELMGFRSIIDGLLADLQFGVSFNRSPLQRFDSTMPPMLNYSTNVEVVHVYPGSQLDLSGTSAEALLINGFANVALPPELILPTDIPVVVMGRGDLVGVGDNVVTVKQLPLPTCLAKMMVGVGVTNSVPEFMQWFTVQQRNEPLLMISNSQSGKWGGTV